MFINMVLRLSIAVSIYNLLRIDYSISPDVSQLNLSSMVNLFYLCNAYLYKLVICYVFHKTIFDWTINYLFMKTMNCIQDYL